MQHQSKKHGFTLIEILLVIAIIGVMAVFSMRFFGAYSENTKVHEATTQVQKILQATLSYYSDQKQWPRSLEQSGFINEYLVKKDLITPWGQTYIGYPESAFQFHIEVPMQKIRGQKIAASLANVTYDASSQHLIAQIVALPQDKKSGIKLVGAGQNITDGMQVSAVCNSNETAEFFFTPHKIETNNRYCPSDPDKQCPDKMTVWPISSLIAQTTNCATTTPQPGQNKTTCTVNIKIKHGITPQGSIGDPGNIDNGTATMNYFAVCRGAAS